VTLRVVMVSVIMMILIMLSVIMKSVIMLRVTASIEINHSINTNNSNKFGVYCCLEILTS
jgi:hypothetical protein